MRNLLLLVVVCCFFSCNKESIRISGKIEGVGDSKIELKLNTKSEKSKTILSDVQLKDGAFDAFIENVKPPFKMTLVVDAEKEYDIWIFRYGKFNFEIDKKELVIVNNSFENTEYDRILRKYQKAYMDSLADKISWVQTHKSEENLCEEDEGKLFKYRKEIKKAVTLRKKSILSTYRNEPQNPIAMALIFDEFENLTSWQKEECLKNASKYFSDCAVNWQLKN
jgi:hypothetical protein